MIFDLMYGNYLPVLQVRRCIPILRQVTIERNSYIERNVGRKRDRDLAHWSENNLDGCDAVTKCFHPAGSKRLAFRLRLQLEIIYFYPLITSMRIIFIIDISLLDVYFDIETFFSLWHQSL